MKMFRNRRQSGFTLVELLVVIGLMALLGGISVSGYFAATRGMKTRGVVQDTASFIRQAQQACLIDQVPTAVLFVNRYTGKKRDGGEMYGTAIAIKMVGRISNKVSGGKSASGGSVGNMLVDEFADWNVSYPRDTGSSSDKRGTRLFNMRNIESTAKGGLKSCSSLMNGWVGYVRMSDLQDNEQLLVTGIDTQTWCNRFEKNANDNMKNGAIDYRNGNDFRWGLSFHSANDGLGYAQWQIGDAYGTQIGEFDLPRGYIFGSSAPQDNGEAKAASVAAVVFSPEDVKNVNDYKFNIPTITISAAAQRSSEDDITKIGEVRSKDLEDQD